MAKARARCTNYHNCKSVKNKATYAALKRCGHSKEAAARISNAALNKGHKMGVHRGLSRC